MLHILPQAPVYRIVSHWHVLFKSLMSSDWPKQKDNLYSPLGSFLNRSHQLVDSIDVPSKETFSMGIHLLCGWRWQCHTLKRYLLQSMPKSTLEGTYTVWTGQVWYLSLCGLVSFITGLCSWESGHTCHASLISCAGVIVLGPCLELQMDYHDL